LNPFADYFGGVMKTFTAVLIRFTLLVGLLLLAGCTMRVPKSFPQTDIVFQRAIANDEDRERRESVGFVDADGTNLTIVSLSHQPEALAAFPTWSHGGSTLVFRGGLYANPTLGSLLILQAGKEVLSCSGEGPFGTGRVSLLGDARQAAVESVPDLPDKLVLINLADCSVARTYLKNEDDALFMGVSATSDGQLLVFSRSKNIGYYESQDDIVVLDVASNTQTVVGHGRWPAWLPDDQRIVYTASDGIYITRQDGSQKRRVIAYSPLRKYIPGESPSRYAWEEWPPAPSWSPDGKWLVYHKCMLPLGEECQKGSDFSIFKVNVETGEEVKIVDGGLNPYWRQK
jgi:hypothetical protein